MARIRNIKPEFFEDETLAKAPLGGRLLYVSLWTRSDLNGVFEWNIKVITAFAFPHDDGIDAACVDKWMACLVELGRVVSFEASGKRYGIVRRFSDHQFISKSERDAGPKYPFPDQFGNGSSNHSKNGSGNGSGNGYQNTGHRTQDTGHRTQDIGQPHASTSEAVNPAPANLPARLRDAYREIGTAYGWEVAVRCLEASIRLFRVPSEKQYLATYQCASEAGVTDQPSDQWPDFRKKIQADQARQKTGSIIGGENRPESLNAYRELDRGN